MSAHVPDLFKETGLSEDRFRLTGFAYNLPYAMAANAYDTRTGGDVFIKIKDPSFPETDKFVIRMAQEARALRLLRHPQIPRLIEARVGEGVELPYTVQEHMPGDPEFATEARNQLSPVELAQTLFSALVPVQYVHEQGLLHRDLRTENHCFPWAGKIALVDFEVSIGIDKRPDMADQEDNHAISIRYVSPERFGGGRGTVRSDVYSAGAVGYSLFFGRTPNRGQPGDTQAERFAWPLDLSPNGAFEVPDMITSIIVKAMEYDPRRRYESIAAMMEDVQRYIHDNSTPTERAEMPDVQPTAAAGRRAVAG